MRVSVRRKVHVQSDIFEAEHMILDCPHAEGVIDGRLGLAIVCNEYK